jgi:5-methylcytosine-specific restriction endonuclease McrA
MAFSESTKDAAFRRSGGQCECRRSSHGHWTGRCSTKITRHGAEYHHVVSQDAGGSDGLENCEALCVSCHQKTKSYGG